MVFFPYRTDIFPIDKRVYIWYNLIKILNNTVIYMKTRFGIKNEAFKLRTADRWNFNPAAIDDYGKTLDVICARGDTAAFQVVVWCDDFWAINVGESAWFSQHRRGQMPVIRVAADCDFETMLNIEDMLGDNDGTPIADALLGCSVAEIPEGDARAVWCEVKVPKDTPAGNYSCTVSVFKGCVFDEEEKLGECKVNIEVLDYVMPEPSEYRMHLDLWQHNSNIARKADVPLWSDAHFEVMEEYVKSLAQLGQKAMTIIVSEIPWSGQSCFYETKLDANMFEYSIIPITKTESGFVYDFTKMQRYIDICEKYGIREEISLYGLANVWKFEEYGYGAVSDDYPDAIRVRYLDKTDGCYKYMKKAAEIDDYIKALEKYFIDTNQIDRVRLAADEPGDIEAYRKSLGHLHSIAPSFKFKAAINHAEFIGEFGNEVYDFVPYIFCLSKEYDKIKEYKRTMDGKRFLWYVCCGPHFLNTFLSSDLCESYYIGVLTSYLGLDGFLRWNYTVWPDDPRHDIRCGRYWKAGDYNFVYPGSNGKPLYSIRWKALKRGIELFELLERLRDTGDTEALDKAYGMVVKLDDVRKYYDKDRTAAELCSLEYNDYAEMKRFVIGKLIESSK